MEAVEIEPSKLFSIGDIIHILYIEGLIKLDYWEDILENLKSCIIDQKSVLIYISLYIMQLIGFVQMNYLKLKCLRQNKNF